MDTDKLRRMDHPEYRALFDASDPALRDRVEALGRALMEQMRDDRGSARAVAEYLGARSTLARDFLEADAQLREELRPRMEWINAHPEYQ